MAPLRKAAQFRVLAAQFTRGLPKRFAPQESEGAGNAGCALHPRSRVQNCAKNAHEHTGSAEAIRHSLRNGFTACFELSPEYRAFLPPSPSDMAHPRPVGPTCLRRLDANH